MIEWINYTGSMMEKTINGNSIFAIGTIKKLSMTTDKKGLKMAFATLTVSTVEIDGIKMEITKNEINLAFPSDVWKNCRKKYHKLNDSNVLLENCEVKEGTYIYIQGIIDINKNWFKQTITVKEVSPLRYASKDELNNLPSIDEFLETLKVDNNQIAFIERKATMTREEHEALPFIEDYVQSLWEKKSEC